MKVEWKENVYNNKPIEAITQIELHTAPHIWCALLISTSFYL